MQNFFIYMAESSVLLGILYFLYTQLFYKETYFEWNRIYLLAIVVLSLVFPLIKLPYELFQKIDMATVLSIESSDFYSDSIFANVLLQKEETSQTGIFTVLFYFAKVVYFVALLYFSSLFVRNLVQILQLKRTSKLIENSDFVVVETQNTIETFSFFKTIFLGKNFQNLSENERNQILDHEKVHAKQFHSLDILFVEVVKIIFWFNPIIWQLKQKVKEIHEYIVDAEITKKNLPAEYSKLIVKLSIKNIKNYLPSAFGDSKVKNRILMLANKESQWLRKRKFLIGLPLLFFVLLSFAFTKSMLLGNGSSYTYSYKEFSSPVPLQTKIVTPYFTNKFVTKTVQKGKQMLEIKYSVSHKEITFNSFSKMPVKAIAEGKIINIAKRDNWGAEEFEIKIQHKNNFVSIYKKLSECRLKLNANVMQGDTLAIMDDNEIYKIINFRLLNNNKAVNPLNYIEY